MACTSLSLSNNIINHKFRTATPTNNRSQLRISAVYATAEVATQNALQTPSFYQVLGVQKGATCQEIKSAYRSLARALHPDVASSNGADEFMRVHAAYATLSDPEKRALYDSTLFRRRTTPAGLSSSGFNEMNRRRRTWETDQCW
ncbi:hypothetical protein RD792_005670 [Penstemon davidsonii]|uniref:J domain-containing protein n=1 Tax=Penstemon davidsonii TaxID=160366 RepID=A0ABR0DEK4_9LAMI|nr:hypothetical protein RD792_005670 [Penstemon davidsonii]